MQKNLFKTLLVVSMFSSPTFCFQVGCPEASITDFRKAISTDVSGTKAVKYVAEQQSHSMRTAEKYYEANQTVKRSAQTFAFLKYRQTVNYNSNSIKNITNYSCTIFIFNILFL